jgi:NAD(P)-dependent dehydrogenase (short-subunit alcohol dehydrogenase family)
VQISGAVAVVTGGHTGIGRATIEALEAEGATAVSWDIDGPGIRCDVRDPAAVTKAIETTVAEYGVPTILVASAGTAKLGRLVDLTVEEWDLVYDVNVRGMFLCLQAVARAMLAARVGGSIVLVGSVNGTIADPAHALYSTSKAAVQHLGRCAATELGDAGIRVNTVAPGPTATPMMGPLLADDDYRRKIGETTPLGRLGEPEDISLGILNVIKTPWMTGQTIALDGGSSLMTSRGQARAEQIKALRAAAQS